MTTAFTSSEQRRLPSGATTIIQECNGSSENFDYEGSATWSSAIQEDARPTQATSLRSILGTIAHIALCLAWIWYLHARLRACWYSTSTTAAKYRYEWLILLCEVVQACPEILQIMEITTSFAAAGSSRRPSLKLRGDTAPMVHVFVTVCGEDVDIIMDTVHAAAIQNYPKSSYRVFVLDDSKDDRLRLAVDRLNERLKRTSHHPVCYLDREKKPGIPHYYKSGNLRFGHEVSKELYGSSEFVAALDADMIPEADWLAKTVPHLLRSPTTALVSPPQLSYNIPEGDELGQDSNVFQLIMEPIRDSFGCSQCSGSGYVMRRRALDSIGGWPLSNVGEDIVCSYVLVQAGWKAAFIEDELQFGMAPGSLHAYAAQRVRWTAGSLLVARKFNFFLPWLNKSSLSSAQRFFGMHHAFKTYFSTALILPLILLPLLALSPGLISTHETLDRRALRTPYLFLWLSSKIWKYLIFSQVGTKNLSNISRNRYWVVPYHITALLQSFTTTPQNTPFTATGTLKSPLDERSPSHRRPLLERLSNPLVLMHTLYFLFASLALMKTFAAMISSKTQDSLPPNSYIHTAAILRLVEIFCATATPVRYMLFPPSVRERREYLVKDERTGVYRSRRKTWVKREGGVVSWRELVEVGVVFVGDWL
ncbi:glycosyltransferase family 2 protein [Zasmidium cellare ATCC 36951]|uniref:Glycosyltransferase family 2 protein n=1 Tax=Zasmidium cellare ATCC 36951 TaxID=1080233 RepID=A0A6A6CNB1_ZASCE|nr:glycosyltransferase family 2 protein [Zasmidium cellare ATCC 36951]KAF2166946.1 glycosyltransferase family 2 protein [Zasmidium cellare ATCC 36951]